MQDIRRRLIEILRCRSLKIGRFTLTSGLTSFYYFDSKPTTLDPEGAYLTAKLILESIREQGIEVDAIGGMTLGADPIVSAVAAVSFAERGHYRPLPAFIVRKGPKKHGTERFIEGFSGPSGTSVAIIDDVCTTGGSTLNSIHRAEEAGYRVEAVFALVDRLQGGSEALSSYRFLPLITSEELLDDPGIQEAIKRVGPMLG